MVMHTRDKAGIVRARLLGRFMILSKIPRYSKLWNAFHDQVTIMERLCSVDYEKAIMISLYRGKLVIPSITESLQTSKSLGNAMSIVFRYHHVIIVSIS